MQRVNDKHRTMIELNAYGKWLSSLTGYKTQKISIHAGFTCPNRDGTLGTTGCTYCNNQTFNPAYCQPAKSITRQLEEGKQFFGKKYPQMHYLAYFQAYTNTYAPLSELRAKYEEALSVPLVDGIVIGTRPDCVSDEVLDLLEQLNRQQTIIVEYGIESVYDETLRRIRRGHTHRSTYHPRTPRRKPRHAPQRSRYHLITAHHDPEDTSAATHPRHHHGNRIRRTALRLSPLHRR